MAAAVTSYAAPEEAAAIRRRRNCLLDALTSVQRRAPHLSLSDVVALLYVAENPGISIAELAYVSGATTISASRAARRLSAQYDQPRANGDFEGFVDIRPNPDDGRGLQLSLSPAGEAFCDELNAIISDSIPIVPSTRIISDMRLDGSWPE